MCFVFLCIFLFIYTAVAGGECGYKCKYIQCHEKVGRCLQCEAKNWRNKCQTVCTSDCLLKCIRSGSCEHCAASYYEDCNITCSDQRPQCLTCEHNDGQCTKCSDGFWGKDCEDNCPTNCPKCDTQTGLCIICSQGFWGGDCVQTCVGDNCKRCNIRNGTCDECASGYWGETCQHQCSEGCGIDTCEKDSGICGKCQINYWGETCNKSCDIDQCLPTVHLQSCDKAEGPTCEVCNAGYWGSQCNSCPKLCSTNLCDQSSGTCFPCHDGYWGDFCNMTCNDVHCAKCRKEDGRCLECLTQFWGQTCQNVCDLSHCLHKQCDFDTGKCTHCMNNYWGWQCNHTCLTEDCLHIETCSKDSGPTCSKCVAGKWGERCTRKCYLSHCKDDQCNKDNGTCENCDEGYWGSSCSLGCFISDCLSLITCSKETGPKCYFCGAGKWGEQCQNECQERCATGCRMVDGACTSQTTENYNGIMGISIGVATGVTLILFVFGVLVFKQYCKRIGSSQSSSAATSDYVNQEVIGVQLVQIAESGAQEGTYEQLADTEELTTYATLED